MVIDLGPLKAIHVDPARRIAWVQPGVVWGELDAATQEHGLAVTGGRVSSTGVAGFTLGSGSGWLERKMGLAADNLRAARVVTADGHVVTASETENPDLFWAIRGGGGNFGIVVEFEFALRPVGPLVLGGMLLWPRERAGEVMRAYRDLMADAPDALCGGLALMTAPPLDFVPAELQGRPAVGVIVLYAGELERGAEHIAPLRALAPAVDVVQPMPYCAVQSMMDKGHPEALRNYYRVRLPRRAHRRGDRHRSWPAPRARRRRCRPSCCSRSAAPSGASATWTRRSGTATRSGRSRCSRSGSSPSATRPTATGCAP